MKAFVVVILISYVFISLFLGFIYWDKPGVGDYFPLFSWSLFRGSFTPKNKSNATLRVTSVNGEKVSPALYFHDAPHVINIDRMKFYLWYKLFENLANSIRRQDKQQIAAHRKSIEENFLLNDVEYEIVMIDYDPLKFFHSRRADREEVLARFMTQQ